LCPTAFPYCALSVPLTKRMQIQQDPASPNSAAGTAYELHSFYRRLIALLAQDHSSNYPFHESNSCNLPLPRADRFPPLFFSFNNQGTSIFPFPPSTSRASYTFSPDAPPLPLAYFLPSSPFSQPKPTPQRPLSLRFSRC